MIKLRYAVCENQTDGRLPDPAVRGRKKTITRYMIDEKIQKEKGEDSASGRRQSCVVGSGLRISEYYKIEEHKKTYCR